ncbi:unnamed protein product [Strongylus vulgaris]|uniref:Potassium channel tetramerisation-type BTB domain-containing protein n=1 Tax=Strongylus vulgaris TaxID=40348 RepID=A0A3P7JAM3_STRVU|nr:unnamed protein product [Strongylus vulgaris]
MVDRTWKTSGTLKLQFAPRLEFALLILVSEPIFIDRDPKYFGLLLEFLATGNVDLPRSDIELAAIIQEAEFYQVDELIAKIIREDRRCFGEGPPFFPKDRVVWKTRNFWRLLSQNGWNFDGSRKDVPLCFTYFTLFSRNETCYMCGVETKDLNGLYKSLFDFSRDFSYTTGEIEKIYGDCCCCDVRFGKSSFIFHVPTKMLRLAD